MLEVERKRGLRSFVDFVGNWSNLREVHVKGNTMNDIRPLNNRHVLKSLRSSVTQIARVLVKSSPSVEVHLKS